MHEPPVSERYRTLHHIASSIDGFMSETNIAIWDALLSFQSTSCIQGNLLEIGVYKGRSASILCQHKRGDEHLWLVDYSEYIEQAKTNLSAIAPSKTHFIRVRSSVLWAEPTIASHLRQVRWIHIDGEHTGYAAANDLSLAETLLSDDGVICVDDFFNPAYPQITAAVYMWLSSNPSKLELIFCGENKAYLSRPTSAHRYYKMIRENLASELRERGICNLTLFKTSPVGDSNTWGAGRRYLDRDYYGLDENPDALI